jgi:hypothetical protein
MTQELVLLLLQEKIGETGNVRGRLAPLARLTRTQVGIWGRPQ